MFKRVYIEITNICNLRCRFCSPHGRTPHRMSVPEFAHILNEVSSCTDHLYLHVQGEPLSHPDIDDILQLCDEAGKLVQIVTNGSYTQRYDILFEHPCVRRVSFSLQSLPFQPEATREAVFQAILQFIQKSSEAGRFITELRFWADSVNDPAVSVLEKQLRDLYVFEETKRKDSYRILPDVYVSYDHLFEWPDTDRQETDTHGRCLGGIDQLAVLSDGTVVPCCLDAKGVIALGNLFQQPMTEILASKRYTELTEGFRRHYLSEELCRSCSYRRRFRI